MNILQTIIGQVGLEISSGLLFLSVSSAAWTVFQVLTFPKSKLNRGNSFEINRLERVRNGSSTFRWFEPIVKELSKFYNSRSQRIVQLERNLKVSDETAPWQPKEFLATKTIEAFLSAVAVFLLVAVTGYYWFAAFLAFMLLVSYTWMAEQSVRSKSNRKMKAIRLRLPFAVDQIALMMQAGAEFEGCLETTVRDNADHPLTLELREVLRQVTLGRPRSQALNDLRQRLDDKDISELVFAINKGEELGTPLSSILREQADQMRLKRSQWAEQAASEAEVQMVFPGMVVMVACLLVIIAPILLPAVMTFLE